MHTHLVSSEPKKLLVVLSVSGGGWCIVFFQLVKSNNYEIFCEKNVKKYKVHTKTTKQYCFNSEKTNYHMCGITV